MSAPFGATFRHLSAVKIRSGIPSGDFVSHLCSTRSRRIPARSRLGGYTVTILYFRRPAWDPFRFRFLFRSSEGREMAAAAAAAAAASAAADDAHSGCSCDSVGYGRSHSERSGPRLVRILHT